MVLCFAGSPGRCPGLGERLPRCGEGTKTAFIIHAEKPEFCAAHSAAIFVATVFCWKMEPENPYQSPLEDCSSGQASKIIFREGSWLWLFFSPDGRISRKKFWIGYLIAYLVLIISSVSLDVYQSDAALYLQLVPFLLMGWVLYALMAKRCHDRDKSQLWLLLMFLPVVGPMWLCIEAGFFRGTDGTNRFGPGSTKLPRCKEQH